MKKEICSHKISWFLDNPIRKLIHNPKKIFKKYLQPNTIVLDFGCASGFFSKNLAKLLPRGKVVAVDIQEEMLKKLKNKIKGTNLEKIIITKKCNGSKISLKEKVDFVLAFWVIHEVPNQKNTLKELKEIMKKGAKVLIAEPKGHVSKAELEKTLHTAEKLGFKLLEMPKIAFSRAILLEKK
jgi:ubiquinone/menaquinone biosynthesis C-methylase UbiE